MSCNLLQKIGVAVGALRVGGAMLCQPGLSGQWGEAHCKEMSSGPGLLSSCPLVKAIQQTFTEHSWVLSILAGPRDVGEKDSPCSKGAHCPGQVTNNFSVVTLTGL